MTVSTGSLPLNTCPPKEFHTWQFAHLGLSPLHCALHCLHTWNPVNTTYQRPQTSHATVFLGWLNICQHTQSCSETYWIGVCDCNSYSSRLPSVPVALSGRLRNGGIMDPWSPLLTLFEWIKCQLGVEDLKRLAVILSRCGWQEHVVDKSGAFLVAQMIPDCCGTPKSPSHI